MIAKQSVPVASVVPLDAAGAAGSAEAAVYAFSTGLVKSGKLPTTFGEARSILVAIGVLIQQSQYFVVDQDFAHRSRL